MMIVRSLTLHKLLLDSWRSKWFEEVLRSSIAGSSRHRPSQPKDVHNSATVAELPLPLGPARVCLGISLSILFAAFTSFSTISGIH